MLPEMRWQVASVGAQARLFQYHHSTKTRLMTNVFSNICLELYLELFTLYMTHLLSEVGGLGRPHFIAQVINFLIFFITSSNPI